MKGGWVGKLPEDDRCQWRAISAIISSFRGGNDGIKSHTDSLRRFSLVSGANPYN